MKAAQHLESEPNPEPSAVDRTRFRSPRDVVESPWLVPGQQLRLLVDWLEDEQALAIADEEGMRLGRPPRIRQVREALRILLDRRSGRR